MPEMLGTTSSSTLTIPSNGSTFISSKTGSSTRFQFGTAQFSMDWYSESASAQILQCDLRGLVLPRKHCNITFFYLSTFSIKVTLWNLYFAVKCARLVPCHTCPLQHCTAPSPPSRQQNQAKTWDVHGQTAVEMPPGNLAPAAALSSKWLIRNGVWNGECSVCIKHLHLHLQGHFQQVTVQSLSKEETETTGQFQRKLWPF